MNLRRGELVLEPLIDNNTYHLKVRGQLNCFTSHLLWRNLYENGFISKKFKDGITRPLRELYGGCKLKKDRKYQKFILDLADVELNDISAIAISVEMLGQMDGRNLEIYLNSRGKKVYELTKLMSLFEKYIKTPDLIQLQ